MELKNRTVLVTGAAGFIGSTLVKKLLDLGSIVVGIDNFSDYYLGKEENISNFQANDRFHLIRDTILNYDVLCDAMKDTQIVFHLAAQPGVRFSLENPTITNCINTEGTLNVLMAAKKTNVKRIINASSSSVYGNQKYSPVDETHPNNPLSIYGVSKLAAEKYCEVYNKIHNQSIISLRYHTVYGPRGRPDMAIFKWIDALYHSKPITIFGDGTQTRDMTFVDDIVDGTLNASMANEISYDVFNLASGRTVSMNYVLEKLEELTNKETKIIYEDFRKDDAKDTHGNIQKATKLINYHPKVTIEQGLKNTINWYKEKFNF